MSIEPKRRITISAKLFNAAWQFISTEETRYYLNGVYIEPHPDGGVTMIATDGICLVALRDIDAHIEGTESWICGLPKQPFAPVLKRKNSGALHFVDQSAYVTDSIIGNDAFNASFDPTKISREHLAIGFAPAIDGTFPDWRKVIPTTFDGQTERTTLNGKILERFTKALAPLKDDKGFVPLNIITPPSEGVPVIIHSETIREFFGIAMPIRSTRDDGALPDWLNMPETKAKPKPANDAKPENVPDTDAA